MVKIRMRKTMKRNKVKKHQKYSRKHKKTIRQKRHHKGGKYSKTLRGGDICLKEVTDKTPPEVNRIGDENTNLAKKSSSGSLLGNLGSWFGNKKKETTPIQEVEIVDEKITDDIENPLLSSEIEDTSIVSSPLQPEEAGFVKPPPPPASLQVLTQSDNRPPPPPPPEQVSTQSDDQSPPPPPPEQVPTQSDDQSPPGRPEADPPVVDQRLAPYIKLRTIGIPDAAIRSKMQLNGFTQADIDGLLGPDLSASAPEEPYSRPPPRTLKPAAPLQVPTQSDNLPPVESKIPNNMLDQIKEGQKKLKPVNNSNIPPGTPTEDTNVLKQGLLKKFENTRINVDEKNDDENNEDDNKEWQGGKSRRRRRKMKSSRKKRKTTRK